MQPTMAPTSRISVTTKTVHRRQLPHVPGGSGKAPKPLPACATPVTDGMKVHTTDTAVKAQQGVMEFLLINHPLDCPICDQGGECQLQDLAVGYGGVSLALPGRKARRAGQRGMGPLVSAAE